MSEHYYIPASLHRTEYIVINSRFVTSIGFADSSILARQFIADIRDQYSDANHHVYAFRVGYGNSIVEGMSDDGEPTGTAGPPTLAVLRGTDLGDIVLVTTRYFGGTKLGTGGLVRAYTESAQHALANLPRVLKAAKQILRINLPYHLYESVKRLIYASNGVILEETFTSEVTLTAQLLVDDISNFTSQLQETTSGQINPQIFDE